MQSFYTDINHVKYFDQLIHIVVQYPGFVTIVDHNPRSKPQDADKGLGCAQPDIARLFAPD